MQLFLYGRGKMGTRIAELASARGHSIVSSIERCACAIDFSHASVVKAHVTEAVETNKPIVIGTTGWEHDLDDVKEIVERGATGAIYAPNFSIGVALFIELLKQAQALFPHYTLSGSEIHHTEKRDAPSGTAKQIAQTLNMEAPFSSKREKGICGIHMVSLDSPVETITLSHEAKSRDGFASGALDAAEWIQHKKGWYTLDALYSPHHAV